MSINVDYGELRKFAAAADEWWSPRGRFRALHWENPVRLRYLESAVELAGKSVVDVGCGGGILAESMAARGARVTAIDLSAPLLEVARRHAIQSGLAIDYRLMAVERLAEAEPARFDLVTCVEMLEHVPDPASVVQACGRLVKRDGWVFLSTFDRTARSYLLGIIGAEYCLRLVPRGSHRWRSFIRPAELAAHCHAASLSIVNLTGSVYDPVRRAFGVSPDTSVHYYALARPDHSGSLRV